MSFGEILYGNKFPEEVEEEIDFKIPSEYKGKNIRILPQDYGYLVTVGCKDFAIETVGKLCNLLSIYLHQPALTEERWFNKDLNIEHYHS